MVKYSIHSKHSYYSPKQGINEGQKRPTAKPATVPAKPGVKQGAPTVKPTDSGSKPPGADDRGRKPGRGIPSR